jgi:two-component system chemotaxis response regulator CheV
MAESKEGILLESGTNEVELLEFIIDGQGFGVNVAKTQAIEQYDHDKVTEIPMVPSSMAGMLLFRNRTIPLIDLGAEMGIRQPGAYLSTTTTDEAGFTQDDKKIVLVMEFNNVTTAAIVDGVNRIHRISWNDISPLSTVLANDNAAFTGSVNIEKREILVVDMEKIVASIMPTACLEEVSDDQLSHPRATRRRDVKIYLAEDSSSIRSLITSTLQKGQYEQVTAFDNGLSAWETIRRKAAEAAETGADIRDYVTIIISDIEMPQMDGLTLCRHLKESPDTRHIRVVMFSSLINEQMAEKCRSVKADDWISKPQIAELISLLDKHCLTEEPQPA